jgi:hypothetical protein
MISVPFRDDLYGIATSDQAIDNPGGLWIKSDDLGATQ